MGKILGAILGFVFLGPLGVLLGLVAGHFFIDGGRLTRTSRSQSSRSAFSFGSAFNRAGMQAQIQELYFKLFFSMLGKMAKADGKVTKSEGDYLLKILGQMSISSDARSRAIVYFNEAKNTDTPITQMAQQFAQLCGHNQQLKNQMLSQLVAIANVDNHISSEEESLLKQVASIFGISDTELQHMLNSVGANTDAVYHTLGVSKNASDAEVKKAYRTLIKEYHPDVLRSKGLPDALMEDAKKRFLHIQESWNSVKKARGLSE